MRVRRLSMLVLFLMAICRLLIAQAVSQVPRPQRPPEDVVRVNTTLVQTDVMVFNKQGSFIDGLKPEQFVLKIDGKARPISFFERVVAGSRNEEAQLAAARGNAGGIEQSPGSGVVPLDRGRTIFFLADDFHLSAFGTMRTRELLLRFVDREMGQNDEAAITSTSGQIGFLQQLTDNKAVLRAAIERLKPRPHIEGGVERPPMSEYQALKIDQNEFDVVDFFVDQFLKDNPGVPRQFATEMVHSRATQILQLAGAVTTRTLATVESLVRNARSLPGRKILFLISEGFFLDERNSDAYDRLRRITSLAATNGLVIYSIDARGLATGMEDASRASVPDPSGRLQRGTGGELTASQDGLHVLASDTGGRAFFNSNALSNAVTAGLKESSTYYLLAWRPESDEQKNQKFRRIEVSVIGRPDLIVRFRRGFGEVATGEQTSRQTKPAQASDKQPGEVLATTLKSPYPKSDLPVTLSLNFLDDQRIGMALAVALKVSTRLLKLEPGAGGASANLDVAGNVFDDQGKSVSAFNKRLTIKAVSEGAAYPPNNLFYHHLAIVKPGLYQIRVAALDVAQRRSGSAVQWIEIPDLGSKALAMSSLIVGEKKAEAETQQIEPDPNSPETAGNPFREVVLNVDHRFARSSRLRFLTFVYNAARTGSNASMSGGGTVPTASGGAQIRFDLAVQIQVFRDNEPVITTPLRKIDTDGVSDPARVPYAADVFLDSLQPGQYTLQVTIIDRLNKASVSQRYDFHVD